MLVESGGDELRLNEIAWQHGLEFILRDPMSAVVRVTGKWQRLLESDHEIAGWAFEAPGSPWSGLLNGRVRRAACAISDVWYAWLALTTLLAGSYNLRTGGSPRDLLWPLLAIATAMVAHGIFESQPRYFVLYQCFWALLASGTWRSAHLTAIRRRV